jgi:hypothetical protein
MASGPASSPARSGDWSRPVCSSSVECVMDDVVEPAAGQMLLPKVLAALADPFISALPVADLRAQADDVARHIREVDTEIQRTNWEVDLLDE